MSELEAALALNNGGMDEIEEEAVLVEIDEEYERMNAEIQRKTYGTDSVSWLEFLKGIKTGPKYRETVDEFVEWHKGNWDLNSPGLLNSLVRYFTKLSGEVDGSGKNRYSPPTLRSLLSIFNAFWLHSGEGNLKEKCPILESRVSNLERGHKVKKAKAFTKEEIIRLMELPNDSKTLLWKVYVAIGCAFAGRGCEIVTLTYDCLEEVTSRGKQVFHVTFERSKEAGSVTEEKDYHIIAGSLEVTAIRQYLKCFEPGDRGGRLFRKLQEKKNGRVFATKSPLGKNPAGEIGKQVARKLQLPDWEKYTGHCWRTTAITWAANAGLSKNQIKSLSDHQSDSVVDGYIRKSEHMKRITSSAVSLVEEEVQEQHTTCKRVRYNGESSSSSSGPVYNFSGAVFNAPVTLNTSK